MINQIHGNTAFKPHPLLYIVNGKQDEVILSTRETLILSMIDLTDTQIADKLSITESTVQTHIKNAKRKLRVNSRTQLGIIATKNGLI